MQDYSDRNLVWLSSVRLIPAMSEVKVSIVRLISTVSEVRFSIVRLIAEVSEEFSDFSP